MADRKTDTIREIDALVEAFRSLRAEVDGVKLVDWLAKVRAHAVADELERKRLRLAKSISKAGWKILWAKYSRGKAVVHVDMGEFGEFRATGKMGQTIEDMILHVEQCAADEVQNHRKTPKACATFRAGPLAVRESDNKPLVLCARCMMPREAHPSVLRCFCGAAKAAHARDRLGHAFNPGPKFTIAPAAPALAEEFEDAKQAARDDGLDVDAILAGAKAS